MLRLEPVPATSGVDTAPAFVARDPLATVVTPSAPVVHAFVSSTVASPIVDTWSDDEELDDAAFDQGDAQLAALATLPPTVADAEWADENDDFDHGGTQPSVDASEADADRGGAPFLAQLRRAVDDEGGIDEGAMSDFFSADVDDTTRSRFGRRR